MGARDGRLQNESSSLEESKTRDNSSPVHRVTRMDDLELYVAILSGIVIVLASYSNRGQVCCHAPGRAA